MFDRLKNRLHKKDDFDDLEDIRSNVIGNEFKPEPDFPRQAPDFPPRNQEIGFGDPREPAGFSSIDTRFPQAGQSKEDKYEIIDRLNLIESQLSAIRSQTETINERLKNMERSLGRRY